jgi:hypothetical protein
MNFACGFHYASLQREAPRQLTTQATDNRRLFDENLSQRHDIHQLCVIAVLSTILIR